MPLKNGFGAKIDDATFWRVNGTLVDGIADVAVVIEMDAADVVTRIGIVNRSCQNEDIKFTLSLIG